jgi:hypothetical protein
VKINGLKSSDGGTGTLHVNVDQPEGGGRASVDIAINVWNDQRQTLSVSSAVAVSFYDIDTLIEELKAWRSRVRAHTIQERCGCLIDPLDSVTPPCELDVGHTGPHEFTDRTGTTRWPQGSGVDICPAKSPKTGKRCTWRRDHAPIDHKADELGDSWPLVTGRRVATITDTGAHYPDISSQNYASMPWPSEHVRKLAGKDSGGDWRPVIGMRGFIVSEEMRHPVSRAKLYLIDFGENHYAVFAPRGVDVSEGAGEIAEELKETKEIVGWIWRSNGCFFGTNGWHGTRRDAGIFSTIDAARAARKSDYPSVVLKRVVRKRKLADGEAVVAADGH